jgi:hypothetical protein
MTAIAGIQKDVTINSLDGGVVLVTIAGTPADISPSAQPCQSCLVALRTTTDTVYMNINAAATSSTWKLLATPIPVPIANLSMLHFLGGTGNEIIQILYRV